MTGPAASKTALTPRMPLSITHLPFAFNQLLYPFGRFFSMRITNSQGQTSAELGVDLRIEATFFLTATYMWPLLNYPPKD